MIELLMTLTLSQIQPCVWPNRCAQTPAVTVEVAQIQPCVWPNRCSAAV